MISGLRDFEKNEICDKDKYPCNFFPYVSWFHLAPLQQQHTIYASVFLPFKKSYFHAVSFFMWTHFEPKYSIIPLLSHLCEYYSVLLSLLYSKKQIFGVFLLIFFFIYKKSNNFANSNCKAPLHEHLHV